MDEFVINGEKLNVENASEGTHTNKNNRSISSEESAGLSASTFGLPRHSLEDVQAKGNTQNYAAIILNCRNVVKHLWRKPQIIIQKISFEKIIRKCFPYLDQHMLHLWTHIFCNVAHQVTLPRASYNFIVLLLLSSKISHNWSAPDSIRCFINGE